MRYVIGLSKLGCRGWAALGPGRSPAIDLHMADAQRMPNGATAVKWREVWDRRGFVTTIKCAPEDTVAVNLGIHIGNLGITPFVDGEVAHI